MKYITAHDSSDNSIYTIRYRPESGETEYTSESSIDYDRHLAEDSSPLEGPMMGNGSKCKGIGNHNSEGNSFDRLKVRVEKN